MKQVPLQHFLNTQDWTREELDAVLALAADYKRQPFGPAGQARALEGKSIALVFFNSSLRTRKVTLSGRWSEPKLGNTVILQMAK